MLVKFAAICDDCQARSPEYTAWCACWGCGRHVCPACLDAHPCAGPVIHSRECECNDCDRGRAKFRAAGEKNG